MDNSKLDSDQIFAGTCLVAFMLLTLVFVSVHFVYGFIVNINPEVIALEPFFQLTPFPHFDQITRIFIRANINYIIDSLLIISPLIVLFLCLFIPPITQFPKSRKILNGTLVICLNIFLCSSALTVKNNGMFTKLDGNYLFDETYSEVDGFSNKIEYLYQKKISFDEAEAKVEAEAKREEKILNERLNAEYQKRQQEKYEAEKVAELWEEQREERLEQKVDALMEEIKQLKKENDNV